MYDDSMRVREGGMGMKYAVCCYGSRGRLVDVEETHTIKRTYYCPGCKNLFTRTEVVK